MDLLRSWKRGVVAAADADAAGAPYANRHSPARRKAAGDGGGIDGDRYPNCAAPDIAHNDGGADSATDEYTDTDTNTDGHADTDALMRGAVK